MAGFGGSPGLAVLAGVAKGMTAEQERHRENMRQAVLNRLSQVQIEQGEQQIAASAATQARQAAEESRKAREYADEQEGRAANYAAILDSYSDKIAAGKITRAEAQRRARAQVTLGKDYVDPDKAERDAEEHREKVETHNANQEQSRASAANSRASAAKHKAETEQVVAVPKSQRELIAAQAQRLAEEEVTHHLQLLRTHGHGDDATKRSIAAKQALMTIKRDVDAAQAQGNNTPDELLAMQELLRAIEKIAGEVSAESKGRRSKDTY